MLEPGTREGATAGMRWLLSSCIVSSLLAACAGAPPPVQSPAPTSSGPSSASPAATGQEFLRKALEGFGGAARVDRLRTLVVESETTRAIAGQEVQIHQRSSVSFPGRFRRDVTTGGMTIVSVVTPDSSFVLSPLGMQVMDEAQRVEIERSLARSPLSLLKGRRHDSFTAMGEGSGELDGRPVDYLRVLYVGDSNRLALDRETGQVLELRYSDQPIGRSDQPAEEVVLQYSDYREVDGLVYPFASTVTRAGVVLLTSRVTAVQADVPLADELFRQPVPAGTPAP